MPRHSTLFVLTAALAASVSLPAHADQMFNRIASFAVADNLPSDIEQTTPTSSEIITASEDGMTLVYSDSPLGAVGFIDITDPKAPKAGGIVKIDGEPTSVTVAGGKVLAAINTSESKANPSGNLTVIDLASKKIESSCDLGGQPDSVALSADKSFLAIAIENERDEDLNDGVIPQMPSGNLKIVPIAAGVPDCGAIKTVELTGLAAVAPEDAEAEFVDVNSQGEIVVTLQENNHIAVVDGKTGNIVSNFSAGAVTLDKIDTKKNGAFAFTGKQENVLREPNSAKWLDDNRFVVANEGDYEGGSRSFTIFSKTGEVLYESGTSLEYAVANAGHYPEARNKKGNEPEGLATGTFGEDRLIFVGSERGSLVGVYKDTGAEPQLLQVLPSGIGPEGLISIPARNLFVTANETDLVEDNLARSHVMIFERAEGPADLSDDHRQAHRRRHAARLGSAVGARRRRRSRQALRRVRLGLLGTALDLHGRRHPDPGADIRQAGCHPQRRSGPEDRHRGPCDRRRRRLLARQRRRFRQARPARPDPRRREGCHHPGDRLPGRACLPARPASVSKASPPLAKATG